MVGSPQKKLWYSPYGETPFSRVLSTPGMFPSGSGSLQMLPSPSLPPSRLASLALHLQMSTLPSPANSAAPSPQLSALSFPLINVLPSPFGNAHVEPAAFHTSQPAQPSSWGDWSQDLQKQFEIQIARLTAAAGLPLSWVDNLEWIDFVHWFLPAAKSPSRKVLTTRLIPHVVEEYCRVSKESSGGQNATIQADG
jgi:hypothetical protein